MKQYQKTMLIWLVFGLFILAVWSLFTRAGSKRIDKSFSEIVAAIDNGYLKQVTISGQEFFGEFQSGTKFKTTGILTDNILKSLTDANKKYNTQYKIQKEEISTFWMILAQWLPMLLIIGFFIFFMRQLQAGGGRAMSFGKSKAKMLNENQTKVTFIDVAGIDECKQELEEIVQFLKEPKRFTRLGGRIPKGVLLMGPPGTGKTLLARAVAGEADVPFFSIAGSDFVEMFVGVGASRVRDLFEQGKKHAPCIIFIDEIDAVGRQRGAGMGGGHDEREQTLNQLLVEMDGFESSDGVIIIAATNRPDVLDPAILRPGRFDRRVVVPRPDLLGRYAIFTVHTKKVPLGENVNKDILSRSTPGMSGADIENMINEAALIAARTRKSKVEMLDFEIAREKIMLGAERRTMIMSRKELTNTAYHEAGHALVSIFIKDQTDPIHKVTIIPRGASLGATMQIPTEDRYSMTKTYAKNQIAIMMGGRLAEEIIFHEQTSGASKDFEHATDLAKKMICDWGMSKNLGPLVYGRKEGEIFLGRDMAQAPDYSEQTAQEIDKEIRQLINNQYNRAKKILEDNIAILHAVSSALLDYETINEKDLKLLINGKKLSRNKPPKPIQTKEDIDKQRLNNQDNN